MRNNHLLNLCCMSGKMLGSRNTNIQRNLQYHRERDSGSNTSGERSEFSAGLETTLPDEGRAIQLRLREALVPHTHGFQMLKFAQ